LHRPLIEKCGNVAPNAIEISALAAMLHAFYTGVENIFKRISVESGAGLRTSGAWHRRLLDDMATPSATRPAVISGSLHSSLEDYLNFRHMFRSAYTFDLRWEKMAHLVLRYEEVFNRLEQELDQFLEWAGL